MIKRIDPEEFWKVLIDMDVDISCALTEITGDDEAAGRVMDRLRDYELVLAKISGAHKHANVTGLDKHSVARNAEKHYKMWVNGELNTSG